MGNYFNVPSPPKPGQMCKIVDSSYTESQQYPKNIFGQGATVKVISSKNAMASRPGAPVITISQVEFGDGRRDVYLSSNLK